MKQILLVLFVIVIYTAAMVPRDKRALPSDEVPSSSAKPPHICAPRTPCSWTIYKPIIKMIEMNITNSYCTCGEGTSCEYDVDDTAINAYVYRCLPDVVETSSTTADQTTKSES